MKNHCSTWTYEGTTGASLRVSTTSYRRTSTGGPWFCRIHMTTNRPIAFTSRFEVPGRLGTWTLLIFVNCVGVVDSRHPILSLLCMLNFFVALISLLLCENGHDRLETLITLCSEWSTLCLTSIGKSEPRPRRNYSPTPPSVRDIGPSHSKC